MNWSFIAKHDVVNSQLVSLWFEGNKQLLDYVHLVPPVIREGSSLIVAHVNQDAVLPCEVEGGPSSSVLWRKDGGSVPLHHGR